jgi:uncharacterized damage-inducible protein DinB
VTGESGRDTEVMGVTTERDRILNQLERSFEGEAWHGPSVLEALEGVSWKKALEKPIPAGHSIWELVLHMTAWEDIVRRRLLGEYPQITNEENFPAVANPGDASWKAALEALRAGHGALREVARQITDDQLDQAPSNKTTTRYILLHGIIQHDLYHAGQISILRK